MASRWHLIRLDRRGAFLRGALIVFLSLLGGSLWLAGPDRFNTDRWRQAFPFTRLQVTGEFTHVTARQIRVQVIKAIAGGFFFVDLDKVGHSVSALPWIARVQVGRKWPDLLKVQVTEKLAIASTDGDGLIDREGALFFPGKDEGRGLPVVDIPVKEGHVDLKEFLVIERLLKTIDAAIARYEEDSRGAVRLTLVSGIQLLLGRQHRRSRLHRFVTFYGQLGDPARIARVDLRYNNGFAISGSERMGDV